MDRDALNNYNYLKLGNKIINNQEYQVFRLQNGTIVNIRQDKNAKYNTIASSIKNASYNSKNPNNKFQNLTESHLFEHMFGNFSLNNGYYEALDDGEKGDCIRFIVKNDEASSIKNIVENQMQQIYFAKFDEETFSRERQALNIELYHKNDCAGKRSEIENIDLNKLRQIRNSLVIPQNIEITIDGNVNPIKVISEISRTNANIKKSQIEYLSNINYENNDLYQGNNVSDVEKTYYVEKPSDIDDKKMIAILSLIKTLALSSDNVNLIAEARNLTYGTDIYLEKDLSKYIFRYSDMTFSQNADDLDFIFMKNMQKLKDSNFTQKELDDAKINLKLNADMFYDEKTFNLSKEEICENLDKVSLSDIQLVIDNIK